MLDRDIAERRQFLREALDGEPFMFKPGVTPIGSLEETREVGSLPDSSPVPPFVASPLGYAVTSRCSVEARIALTGVAAVPARPGDAGTDPGLETREGIPGRYSL